MGVFYPGTAATAATRALRSFKIICWGRARRCQGRAAVMVRGVGRHG